METRLLPQAEAALIEVLEETQLVTEDQINQYEYQYKYQVKALRWNIMHVTFALFLVVSVVPSVAVGSL